MEKTAPKPTPQTKERAKYGVWTILSAATGYSAEHCRSVMRGRRNSKTKAGKIIMQKHAELKEFLNQ